MCQSDTSLIWVLYQNSFFLEPYVICCVHITWSTVHYVRGKIRRLTEIIPLSSWQRYYTERSVDCWMNAKTKSTPCLCMSKSILTILSLTQKMEITLWEAPILISLWTFLSAMIWMWSRLRKLSSKFSQQINRLDDLERWYAKLESSFEQQDKDIQAISINQAEIKIMLQSLTHSIKRIEDKLYG